MINNDLLNKFITNYFNYQIDMTCIGHKELERNNVHLILNKDQILKVYGDENMNKMKNWLTFADFEIEKKQKKRQFFISGDRNNSGLSEDFESRRKYYLISLCLEICSWVNRNAYDYYKQAVNVLEQLV